MKLNPDFIPHDKFHKGYWLKSPKCDWFFFMGKPRKYEIPSSDNFYSTLDEGLKDLVKYLHEKGIPTTPSCTGHIQNEKKYLEIFDSLSNISKIIKDKGITLSNPETSKKIFYKNPKFSLPFSRDEFLEKINEYQKWGVLGMVNKNDLYEKLKDVLPVNKVDNLVLILTKGDNQEKINKNWSEITKKIKKTINTE